MLKHVIHGIRSLRDVTIVSFVAGTLLVGPAHAIPILETVANLGTALSDAALASNTDFDNSVADSVSPQFPSPLDDAAYAEFLTNSALIFSPSTDDPYQVADVNTRLLGQRVDYLGFRSFPGNGGLAAEPFKTAGIFDQGSGGTATGWKDVIDFTCNGSGGANDCSSFHWVFNQDLTNLLVDWNIVKIGVKLRNTVAYFLIDEDGIGAQEGDWNALNYVAFGDNILADWFDPIEECTTGAGRPVCTPTGEYTPENTSYVAFFGTPTDIPEPATLALLGLGLAGLGFARRRKAA